MTVALQIIYGLSQDPTKADRHHKALARLRGTDRADYIRLMRLENIEAALQYLDTATVAIGIEGGPVTARALAALEETCRS